jgi:hypothetical protein
MPEMDMLVAQGVVRVRVVGRRTRNAAKELLVGGIHECGNPSPGSSMHSDRRSDGIRIS